MDNTQGNNEAQTNADTNVSAPTTDPSTVAVSGTPNASPADKGVTGQGNQVEKSTDWRQSPEFRGVTKQLRQYKEQMSARDKELAELRGYVQAQKQGQRTSNVSPEDNQALQRLFNMAFESPEVAAMLREKLGLGQIDELKKNYETLSNSWQSTQADNELNTILSEAKSLGLDTDEVRETLEQLIDEHPVYSQVGYKPGALKSVYRDHFFDRVGELRERALNQKEIEKRNALKNGQTQNPGTGKGSEAAKSAEQRFSDAVKQGIDFSR